MKAESEDEMKCLVLGGCGFLGSHLVDGLLDEGHRVTVFDKVDRDTKNVNHNLDRIGLFGGDFTNKSHLRKAIRGMDYVFHFISTTDPQSSTQDPIYDVETNVVPTMNLLEMAKSTSVKRIIFASSGGTVYGVPDEIPITEDHPTDPICAYGISKLMIEKHLHLYHQLYGLDYVSLRFSNPYGERQDPDRSQGAVAVFLKKIVRGDPLVIWGDGSVVRDYIYVKDLINACLRAMDSKQTKHHIFNVGSGNGSSLNDLIKVMAPIAEKEIEIRYKEERRIDVPVNVLDISLARKVLKWEPKVSIEEGIKKSYQWILQKEDG